MSRTERYAALYSENAPINDQELTPDRYAVVTRQETTGERWIITSDDVKTACNLAAGDVLDGWIPEEIVDLDTGRYGSLEVVVQLNPEWQTRRLRRLCAKRAAWSGLFLVLDDGETILCGDCCPIFAASRDVRPDDPAANVWRTDSTGWTADVYCSGCGDPIIEVEP